MSSQDQDFALITVPPNSKKGFWQMLVVMLGFTFFSASMWTGGSLGTGLNIRSFLLAVLLGNLFLGAYTGLLAYIASKTSLSTHLLSHFSFGVKGSYLASFLLGSTQVGWFGVGVAMFALPVQKATGLNVNLLVALSGILMTSTAYFGFRALIILSFIAVPSITILGLYSVSMAVSSIGGFHELLKIEPQNSILFVTAVSMCIGSFISGGTLTPDFIRFAKSSK
ncbi:MAG: cytosine permease, partial [Pseudomonadota bacterium]